MTAPTLAVLLAASSASPDASPLGLATVMTNLGSTIVLAAAGLWFFFRVYKRETMARDKAEAEIAELNRYIIEKVVPALVEANKALTEIQSVLRERR